MVLVPGVHLFVASASIYANSQNANNQGQIFYWKLLTKSAGETVELGNKQTIEYNKLYY